jgi:hypothetical protein
MSCLLARGAVGAIIYSISATMNGFVSHCTYAVNPLWVEQRLVDIRRLIMPLPLHVQVFRANTSGSLSNFVWLVRTLAEESCLQRPLLCDG